MHRNATLAAASGGDFRTFRVQTALAQTLRQLLRDRLARAAYNPLNPTERNTMKNAIRAGAAAALLALPLLAGAQAKPEPEFTLTGNAGLFSDYRFRGFTQTDYKPAFQGGFDFAHKSGIYLGNWNSNVSSVLYNGASLEMDFYGGYKMSLGGIGLDVGGIYYYYPGTGKYVPEFKAKNFEIYVGGSYGPVSLKLYHSLTDFFGLNSDALGLTPPGAKIDTKGSQYLDLSAAFDLGSGVGLQAHIGYQKVKNYKDLGAPKDNALDYKLGMTYDLSGWILGAAVVGGDKKDFFLDTEGDAGGKLRPVLSLSKSF
jgi:uncharacterized protein (TIGR02001 family)